MIYKKNNIFFKSKILVHKHVMRSVHIELRHIVKRGKWMTVSPLARSGTGREGGRSMFQKETSGRAGAY